MANYRMQLLALLLCCIYLNSFTYSFRSIKPLLIIDTTTRSSSIVSHFKMSTTTSSIGSSQLSTESTSFSSDSIPGTGQVFVCTNGYCRDKGSDATMATFTFLTPPSVPVLGVNCLGKCNKGPNVRILTPEGGVVESSMVRSVEKVVELLQANLHLDINMTSAEVLRLNYEGNIHLRSGEVDLAIDCYDKALTMGDKAQEGVLLVMRGTALLQRAYACRLRHKEVMSIAEQVLPSYDVMSIFIKALLTSRTEVGNRMAYEILLRSGTVFRQLDVVGRWSSELKNRWPEVREGPVVTSGDELLQRAIFSWSLYEHSLLRALQDLLTATVLLPGFAQAWRRAADALSEFRFFHSAMEYYEVALQLDSSLTEVLLPIIERTRMLDRLVTNAESQGWSSEAILALIEE